MLGVVVPLGSAQPMRPTRIVSLHYPCLALKARVQGKIRVRCAVADNGSCFDATVEGGSRSRTVDIDYRFESRGIRASTVNADVDVTFELPNTVNVIAPFDANVPCQTPPLE